MMKNQFIQILEQWWQSRQPREQLILIVLSLLLSFVVLYQGLWLQSKESHQNAKTLLNKQINQWLWMQQQSNVANRLNNNNPQSAVQNGNINQIINSSARKHKITISRFQQLDDKRIVLSINKSEYKMAIRWLYDLSQQQLQIQTLKIKRLKQSGLVSVHTTLARF